MKIHDLDKKLHAVRRRIAQRLEQARDNQNRHIMRLAVEHPSRLLRRQTRWQLPQHPHKLLLVFSHSIRVCLKKKTEVFLGV